MDNTSLRRRGDRRRRRGRGPTTDDVWRELSKASFAVLSYVTPAGEPRATGVVYGVAGRHLYLVVAPDSWKARQIATGDPVVVTVPIRRGGPLSLVFPIPPATVTLRTRAVVHPAGSLDIGSVSERLASLVPQQRSHGSVVLELVPEGAFLTYGVEVSLQAMTDPAAAQAHVPVA